MSRSLAAMGTSDNIVAPRHSRPVPCHPPLPHLVAAPSYLQKVGKTPPLCKDQSPSNGQRLSPSTGEPLGEGTLLSRCT